MLDAKLKQLDRIYRLYGEIAAARDFACRKSCAHCCTCNVTLTTLEGYKIFARTAGERWRGLLQRVSDNRAARRFRPKTTTNAIARLCAADEEVPAEEIDRAGGACPLLEDNRCPIYDVRPFGCRCLVSETKCAATGCAQIDGFLLAVNSVFLQVVEHLDVAGCSGNLTDVLQLLDSSERRLAYESGRPPEGGLVRNQALRYLFVPPEYRDRMQPILRRLNDK